MARWVCAVGLALVVVGCAGGRPSELVGSWSGGASFGEPGEPGLSWHKDYKLRSDGSFVMEGYPSIRITGKWDVAERDGNRFRIVLTDQKMTIPPDTEVSARSDLDAWAELDGKMLTWQGATFTRQ